MSSQPVPECAEAAYPDLDQHLAWYAEWQKLQRPNMFSLQEYCLWVIPKAVDWALQSRSPALDAEVQAEWQPISTAPRDSTRVLIYFPPPSERRRVREAWWRMPYEDAPADQCYWCYDDNGCGLDASIHKIGATHWRPLPPPPALDQGQQAKCECETGDRACPEYLKSNLRQDDTCVRQVDSGGLCGHPKACHAPADQQAGQENNNGA